MCAYCKCVHVWIINPNKLVQAAIVPWPIALHAMSNTHMLCLSCNMLLSAMRQRGGGLQAERKEKDREGIKIGKKEEIDPT